MKTFKTATLSTISHLLDAFPADPIADVLACQAQEEARLALENGWDPAGDLYDVGAMPGSAQAAGDLLGRKLTREETRALELCIRAHIAANAARPVQLTAAAQENVEETGCDPQEDVAAIRSGAHTRESLLAHCLDGADEDRAEGWREYVDAICAAAG